MNTAVVQCKVCGRYVVRDYTDDVSQIEVVGFACRFCGGECTLGFLLEDKT